MKILIDMNLSPAWVRFLMDRGVEAVHWSSVGEASAPDSQILEYAAANGLAVFTHDLDFGALLARPGSAGPSVIQVRTEDVLPSAIGSVVLRALKGCRGQIEAGAIVTVEIAEDRIRLLPLKP
jgi:predicted nuclease of predicted toxin-antitoxin system